VGVKGGGASSTTEPAFGSSTGTDVSLRDHLTALMVSERRFHEERDRRYTEVATEREKALKIKEEADRAALGLAREIQTYKDEKANELRSQIEQERGHYVTQSELRGAVDKLEAQLKPVGEYVTLQQGRQAGIGVSTGVLVTVAGLGFGVIGVISVLANLLTR
jgi:hypothetical protein